MEQKEPNFFERNTVPAFLFFWCLLMLIIDGIAFATKAPAGDSTFEYAPIIFTFLMVITTLWTIVTVLQNEREHKEHLEAMKEKNRLLSSAGLH
eukprot:CAMPEP_0183789808 /NCGR_PEP_ID=MMETSP0803_2-20130417/652_1 /TAXON_ID=195967 /ORGANISM="Crustomastix stigmata, Strain CCMP3273" /LENGTH=93 /DNA_ID=CAMNT_0026033989 /DNA_START=45 /DNA_END=326 /DNA_ORIENTATION=-